MRPICSQSPERRTLLVPGETTSLAIDDPSRAHLEECRHQIAKVLEANVGVREP